MVTKLYQARHTGLPSIVTDPIPAGTPYLIIGEYDVDERQTWTVARGVGTGVEIAVSDPLAPAGVLTTYRLVVGGVETWADWIIREFLPRGLSCDDTVLTSANGRFSVVTTWEDDTPRTWSPGAAYHQPLNQRYPVQYRPLSPGGPSWGLTFRVLFSEITAAREVLDGALVWVTHTLGPDESNVPRAMLCGVDGSISEKRWGTAPKGGVVFSLDLVQLVPRDPRGREGTTGVPIVTWGEAARADIVWGPSTTFRSIRAIIAEEPV